MHHRFPAGLLRWIAVGLALCPGLWGQDVDVERANQFARLSRELAGRGEGFQALALVEAELHPGNDGEAQAYLLFTLGWLEQQVAGQEPGRRLEHLERSAQRYRDGLSLLGDFAPARGNLALVQGDLALARSAPRQAREAWRRSLEQNPDDPTAGLRLIERFATDRSALTDEARWFEAHDHLALARACWEQVLAITPAEAAGPPLLSWLLLEGEAGSLRPITLARLSGGGAALEELRLLTRDPAGAPLPSWAGTLLGRQAVAAALRCLGLDLAAQGEQATALACLERARAVAPSPPLLGRPPVGLHALLDSTDLVEAGPGLDPHGARREANLRQLLDSSTAALVSDLASRQRYHEVLGRTLALEGRWSGPSPDNASYHLRRARALAGERSGQPQPLPDLALLIAAGALHSGASGDALQAYLDAATGFLDLEAHAQAEAALQQARPLAGALGGSPRLDLLAARLAAESDLEVSAAPPDPLDLTPLITDSPPTPDTDVARQVEAPPTSPTAARRDVGWYAVAAVGRTVGGTRSSEVEADLAALSHIVDVDLDSPTLAGRFYAGYRFSGPLSLELGYTDLGAVRSSIGPAPATDLQQFLADVAATHPAPGRGPAAALRARVLDRGSLTLSARLGLWRWSTEVEVRGDDLSARVDRAGTDLFYGLDLAWHRVEWGALRFDIERYHQDNGAAALFTVGVEVSLAHLLDASR